MRKGKHFLYTFEGKQYLEQAYIRDERSTYDIAAEQGPGVYPNLVRRALLHHNMPLRTHKAAQTAALKSGRHPHPKKAKKTDGEV